MTSVKFHPNAQKELEAAEAYYDAQAPGLGRIFLAEVERTVFRIAEQPDAGSPYKRTPVRFRLTRRFPYVIYYTVLWESSGLPLWLTVAVDLGIG